MAFVKKAGKSHGEQFAFSDWATRIKRAKINNVQRSQENVLSLLPPHTTNNHRLPKLDLPHFYGDVLERISFWDSYESTIHCNNTLTPIQKFGYLKAQRYCRTNHSRIRTYKCKLRNRHILAQRTIWSTAKHYQCAHESTYGTSCP